MHFIEQSAITPAASEVPSNYSLVETFRLKGSLTLAQQEQCIDRESLIEEVKGIWPCLQEGMENSVEEGFMQEAIKDLRSIEFDLNDLFKSVKGANQDKVANIVKFCGKLRIKLQEIEDSTVRQEEYRQEELRKVESVLIGL